MSPNVTLTVKNGRFAGQKYQFREPRSYTIGRASDCDVPLPSDYEFLTVSRRHCILDFAPPKIQVRDNGSRNGTQLNGMQIGRPSTWQLDEERAASGPHVYDLHSGDELDVGGIRFQVDIAETAH
jgi:pSer/pThr/pTyr-binding forkhead associated (FHA) protein